MFSFIPQLGGFVALGDRPQVGYIANMGLRDSFKKKIQTVVDRLSGEYSAASTEVQNPPASTNENHATGGEVKVTRARLRRPNAANEQQ